MAEPVQPPPSQKNQLGPIERKMALRVKKCLLVIHEGGDEVEDRDMNEIKCVDMIGGRSAIRPASEREDVKARLFD